MRLAFIRTLGGTFGGDPGIIFGKAFMGIWVQRWPVRGKFIALKVPLSAPLWRFVFGHARSSIFSFGVWTTAMAFSGRNCRSYAPSVVSELGHVSRGS